MSWFSLLHSLATWTTSLHQHFSFRVCPHLKFFLTSIFFFLIRRNLSVVASLPIFHLAKEKTSSRLTVYIEHGPSWTACSEFFFNNFSCHFNLSPFCIALAPCRLRFWVWPWFGQVSGRAGLHCICWSSGWTGVRSRGITKNLLQASLCAPAEHHQHAGDTRGLQQSEGDGAEQRYCLQPPVPLGALHPPCKCQTLVLASNYHFSLVSDSTWTPLLWAPAPRWDLLHIWRH